MLVGVLIFLRTHGSMNWSGACPGFLVRVFSRFFVEQNLCLGKKQDELA